MYESDVGKTVPPDQTEIDIWQDWRCHFTILGSDTFTDSSSVREGIICTKPEKPGSSLHGVTECPERSNGLESHGFGKQVFVIIVHGLDELIFSSWRRWNASSPTFAVHQFACQGGDDVLCRWQRQHQLCQSRKRIGGFGKWRIRLWSSDMSYERPGVWHHDVETVVSDGSGNPIPDDTIKRARNDITHHGIVPFPGIWCRIKKTECIHDVRHRFERTVWTLMVYHAQKPIESMDRDGFWNIDDHIVRASYIHDIRNESGLISKGIQMHGDVDRLMPESDKGAREMPCPAVWEEFECGMERHDAPLHARHGGREILFFKSLSFTHLKTITTECSTITITMKLTSTVFGRFMTYAIESPDKEALLQHVRGLVSRLSPHGKFPGPNPCSIERRTFGALRDPTAVYLCEKTDGLRALLVCLTYDDKNMVLLVSRAWDVYLLPLRNVPKVLFQGTVLDGELVCDDARQWTWLCFDAMVVSGIPVWLLPFDKRLEAARRGMHAYVEDPEDPLTLALKTFFRGDDTEGYRRHLGSVRYPVDGTIITPGGGPVIVGRHQGMLKLKDTHTVDFLFEPPNVLSVYDPGQRAHAAVAKLKLTKSMPSAGSIVECVHNSGAWWHLVGIRHDKTTANDMLTYTKTKVNIKEMITLDDVLGALSSS